MTDTVPVFQCNIRERIALCVQEMLTNRSLWKQWVCNLNTAEPFHVAHKLNYSFLQCQTVIAHSKIKVLLESIL